ncbi:MAG: hypothetical protein ACI4LL_03710 [Anaerovoracaceae bacterium]
MPDINRIVIKGSSGYCCVDEAFNDKVTITEDSISYEYIPYVESEINPKRKWSYKTSSPIFKVKYSEIAKKVEEAIQRNIEEFCTDIGGIEFNITYSDKTKFKETYWVPGDEFKELFSVIKSIVPETEYTPAVLLTSDDYDEEE